MLCRGCLAIGKTLLGHHSFQHKIGDRECNYSPAYPIPQNIAPFCELY